MQLNDYLGGSCNYHEWCKDVRIPWNTPLRPSFSCCQLEHKLMVIGFLITPAHCPAWPSARTDLGFIVMQSSRKLIAISGSDNPESLTREAPPGLNSKLIGGVVAFCFVLFKKYFICSEEDGCEFNSRGWNLDFDMSFLSIHLQLTSLPVMGGLQGANRRIHSSSCHFLAEANPVQFQRSSYPAGTSCL